MHGRGAVLLVLGLLASSAAADTFLLKSGARVVGDVARSETDEAGKAWTVVESSFGTVRFPAERLKRQVAASGPRNTLFLVEMRVIFVSGDVQRSADGRVWEALKMPSASAQTQVQETPPWPTVHPGDRIRTGEDGSLDLDVGFGVVHVDASSEVVIKEKKRSTLSVLRGRMGADVKPREGERTFRVETPQASMGVRGTRFFVQVGEDARLGVDEGVVVAGKFSANGGMVLSLPSGTESELTDADREYLSRLQDIEGFPDVDWALVPAGTLDIDPPSSGPTPLRIDVPASLMSRTEVTNEQFAVFERWIAKHGIDAFVIPGRPKQWSDFVPVSGVTNPAPRAPVRETWAKAYAFTYWLGAELPSESQWEHAARGGTKTRFWWGDDRREAVNYEWLLWNSGGETIPWWSDEFRTNPEKGNAEMARLLEKHRCSPQEVGTKPANPYGLHDMLGNLAEWCQDAWKEDRSDTPTDGTPRDDWYAAARTARGTAYESPEPGPTRVGMMNAASTANGKRTKASGVAGELSAGLVAGSSIRAGIRLVRQSLR